MIKKVLGRTGLEVTQLGYGSMGLRGPNTWGVRVVEDDQRVGGTGVADQVVGVR